MIALLFKRLHLTANNDASDLGVVRTYIYLQATRGELSAGRHKILFRTGRRLTATP